MKKILFVTLIMALAFGCAPKKVVESTYENGNPKVVKYYNKKKGELQLDKEIIYYENKTRKMEGTFKEEKREGIWKAWYDNGSLWSEGEYKGGKRNGIGIAYHPNGKKYIEGKYLDDIRIGKWTFYDTTGNIIKQVNFDEVPVSAENDTVK